MYSLRSREECGQAPGHHQQPPGPVHRVPVRDREDDRTEPVQGDRHEDVGGDEVAKNSEEDHDLAGNLVGPPGDGGGPGDLEWDPDEDDAEVGDGEVDQKQDHPVVVLVEETLPEQVDQRVAVGCQTNHLGDSQ